LLLVLTLYFLLSCASGGARGWEGENFRAYYLGLRALDLAPNALEPDQRERAYAYFEAALKSSNPYIVRAAAGQLILPLLGGSLEAAAFLERQGGEGAAAPRPLLAAALYRLGHYAGILALYEDFGGGTAVPAENGPLMGTLDSWDGLFPHLARLRIARDNKAAAGLRDFLFGAAPGPGLNWAAEEVRSAIPDFLSEVEDAALEGRLATARSSFGAGLALFRSALENQTGFFQRYPALITDLGRCFQFTDSEDEGIGLFLEWEREAPSAPLRYRLLYFAGRIARARGDYNRSRELFTQALAFAPDELQEDACVWYIMDTALSDGVVNPAGLVETWAPRWNDPSYFDDVLDRTAYLLASSGQWGRFPEVLAVLTGAASRASIAKYAYISGRVKALGLDSPAGVPVGTHPGAVRDEALPYFRLAYEAGEGALYYRALGAYFLGEPFLDLDEGRSWLARAVPRRRGKSQSALVVQYPRFREMEFLLGFFDAGIPHLALPLIEAMTEELSAGELRALAEALAAAGIYDGQIRLISVLMSRDDYEIRRRDLELFSPRPFQDIVEEEVRRASLAPELLYGLIRTESAFQAEIVSWAGAVGLTQLMPDTAADMADRIRRQGGPNYTGDMAANLRDPKINIRIGAYYLAYLRDLLEHPLLSILAYNGGMNRVRRWYREAAQNYDPVLPGDLFLETVGLSETREYGRRVLSAALVYGSLYYNVKEDSFLADIWR
jgi:soluble lytic murein transglycosylase